MLTQYAKKNHFPKIEYYVDDGYSGTNFERPDFQRLMNDIKDGKVGIVITKDLSRLGRDYLKTGYLLEDFFPSNNVRFIAINDDVDTDKGINDFTPFKNIMNEWYSKDISKKIRSARKTKALNGDFVASYAPYGYKKDPKDKHKLIIDEEVVDVVKKIFQLACEGRSAKQICNVLRNEQILKPRAKILRDTGKYYCELFEAHPYDWSPTTIQSMIRNKEYLGHIVSNKNGKISYKTKKLLAKPEEEWIIKYNTHEPIIDEETFKIANEKMCIKRRPNMKKERNIFSGILRCADCGKALSLYGTHRRVDAFCCVTYRSFGRTYCSAHYTRYDFLYKAVLNDIREKINKILEDKKSFIKDLQAKANSEFDTSKTKTEKEIKRLEHRINELQAIEKRLYEDMVLGKISEELFYNLSKEYDVEKKDIKEKLTTYYESIRLSKSKEKQIEMFVEVLKKYENIQELDAKLLNELIKQIVVYERELKEDGRTQRIEIEYNFIN